MSLTNSPSKGRNKEMDSLDCLQLGYQKKKKKAWKESIGGIKKYGRWALYSMKERYGMTERF